MMTTPKNVFDTIYLIALIFSTKFTFIIIIIFFVKRISSCFSSLLYLRIQSILLISYFIDYADPSLFLNIINNIFLAGFSSDRIINLTLNFFYLKSNIIFIFLRLASINNIFLYPDYYVRVFTNNVLYDLS